MLKNRTILVDDLDKVFNYELPTGEIVNTVIRSKLQLVYTEKVKSNLIAK